jgi:hypothetical protein
LLDALEQIRRRTLAADGLAHHANHLERCCVSSVGAVRRSPRRDT